MTANAFHNISQIEASLWEAADQLRANSKLTSSEYGSVALSNFYQKMALILLNNFCWELLNGFCRVGGQAARWSMLSALTEKA